MGKNVLVVDDSPALRKSLIAALGDGGFDTFYEADDSIEATRLLESGIKVDVVLTDFQGPVTDNLGIAGWAKDNPRFADLPIMLLLVGRSENGRMRYVDSGASDYIVIPFDKNELVLRIKLLLKRRDVLDDLKKKNDELAAFNERLRKLSITDELTQLYNRVHFFESLAHEINRCRRYRIRTSLILMDLDRFKDVNDRLGHITGDRALKEVAGILKETLRNSDIACRYGGDEFIICLGHTPLKGAVTLSERLRAEIEKRLLGAYGLTASIGVAEYDAGLNESREEFIGRADKALYEAKEAGRNKVMAYGEAD